ncbi:Gfo/Idh/MocA family oxidoreductase [Streptomyces sp. NPDC020362]|uniref:Gfo/Idh/MocA family protein n=1 Tax=unclassified Streptomyces TaxID=2593676 RepID=UPI00340207E3
MATVRLPVPVRIGVLGCADIARRRMLPAFAAEPGTRIAAVASRSAARAEGTARTYGCRAVHGYDALLRSDEVDAVYIPLPAALHAQWTEQALRAGKHVLAEKPLADEPEQVDRLFRLAAERQLALMENVMFPHHSQHAVVKDLVDGGAIGELRGLQAVFAVPPLPHDNIRYRPELGGGALRDTGVYPVRAAVHFLGPGLRVVGATSARSRGHRVDTAGAALLCTPGGVTAQLSFGLDHAYRSSYELWGSTGRITVDRAFTPPPDHAPLIRLESAAGVRQVEAEPDDQVANTVRRFCEAARSGTAPAGAVREQARLLDAVRRLQHASTGR